MAKFQFHCLGDGYDPSRCMWSVHFPPDISIPSGLSIGTTTTSEKEKSQKVPYGEKKLEQDEKEELHSESSLGNLLHGSRLYQLLREDAPDEEFHSVSDRPIRQPSENCFVSASSSLVSLAPLTEHLPPVVPTLSPGLKTFPVSLGSQPASSASLPPEPLTPPRCLSPQPLLLSTSPSRTASPMASWPPLPDPSLALPQWDSSSLPLGIIPQNSSPPNNCSLSSPAPAISILGHSGCPISALSHGQEPPRALCHSSLSDSECQGGHLTCQSPEASVLPDIAHTQVEDGSSYFLNPDVQKVLEILINKKVELKIYKNTKEEGQNIPRYSLGNMLKSPDKEEDPITSQAFWKTKGKADHLPASQQLFYPKVLGDQLQQKCSQLFWGLPILHSESLMDNIRASGASLEISPISFNGLYNHVLVQTNVPPQVFSPQPVVHHVAQPQTLTRTMPSCKTPPVSQKQTQEHVPSLPVVPCPSPPVRASDVSCPTNKKGRQYPIAPTIQYLQHKLLKEQKENRRVLPSVVKKSQKVISQSIDKYQASQENKSSINFPQRTGRSRNKRSPGSRNPSIHQRARVTCLTHRGECFESPRRMITNRPSSSRGICNLLMKERMSQEQKELRMAKLQDPRMSKSKMFVSPERKKSFERPKTGGKEGRFVRGRGVGELIPSSQLREIRDTMGSKSLLLSEKKQASSESTFGNRVRNFLQHILSDKGRGEAESMQKVKSPSTTTQSQGSVTSSRLCMDSGSIDAQVLATTIGRILEEKMKLQHELCASKENVTQGKPQTDRWSSYGKNASLPQQRRIMSNMACGQRVSPKGHSHLTNSMVNTDRESNPAFPPRETQLLTNHFHRMPVGTGTSDHPVHCPRHCTLQKRVCPSQSQNASRVYPSLLTKPDLFH
ncbi:Protein FAM75A3 [Fukomys damarensis]|uniref:Protein FAM75A3 n=1 Tax=Fukomys damarensis TaxID=885580 RepID=A0A091DQP7_FUKDA|nr:Protein FAM75A3 [Fukomys damarensis]